MKKIALIVFAAVTVMLFQSMVSAADYIVKLKQDIRLMNIDTNLMPLIPKLNLYTTDNISDINPETVEFAEEDTAVTLFDSYDYSAVEMQSAHKITEIKSMWDMGVYGKGIRVGVIDSGCSSHETLTNNLCDGADFSGSGDLEDRIGHGTSVCGVLAAQYGFDAIGAAHKARIIPLKFIDLNESGATVGGTVSRLAAAIVSAVDDFDCDIINMSCGTIDSHTLKNAVDYAASKGTVMVAAAGNDGTADYNYPAAYDNVIGVGSVSDTKEHSSFSNSNDSIFITAPGEHVNVIYGTNRYGRNSGTSFSAPYISGIIADMLEINHELNLTEITDILSCTSEDLGDEGYDEAFGYGLVRADKIAEYMLSGRNYYTPGLDLCPEDDFYEIRFRVDGDIVPFCVLAEYKNGALNNIDLSKKHIRDNIFMLRLPQSANIFKYFVWDSFNGMNPM